MAIKIMLDAGHSGYYFNQSPVNYKYYESAQMWKLTEYLCEALERRGFVVGKTRSTIHQDPELAVRGAMAKGYDLFISLHSNASTNASADAPWMIHLSDDSKTIIDEKSKEIARALGNPISNLMGVSQPYYYTKSVDFDRDGNGYIDDEYYGVLFGAKSVGVPAIIIEHSFHTNKKAADWLMDDANLERLAEVEANVLAKYYGVFDKMDERIQKLEKRIEELENQVKPKWAYIDGNLEKDVPWAVDTMRKLVRKGMMKGNSNNSFEMSYLFMRIMVMLDRAGVFGK